MIVWGGWDGSSDFNDGRRYTPAANTWTAVATNAAPAPRRRHSAVWTGTEMVIWGGYNGDVLGDGGRYHPQLDAWVDVSTAGPPVARRGHTAVAVTVTAQYRGPADVRRHSSTLEGATEVSPIASW
jgi:hypothetical protein